MLLGELLVRGGFTDRMYRSLSDWLSPLPGGLLHSNIGSSALFAAVSGSSVATAATIGTVALPTFEKRGYDQRLVLGSIAAGATLGILIPPSINMIIYGAMTNTSVGQALCRRHHSGPRADGPLHARHHCRLPVEAKPRRAEGAAGAAARAARASQGSRPARARLRFRHGLDLCGLGDTDGIRCTRHHHCAWALRRKPQPFDPHATRVLPVDALDHGDDHTHCRRSFLPEFRDRRDGRSHHPVEIYREPGRVAARADHRSHESSISFSAASSMRWRWSSARSPSSSR